MLALSLLTAVQQNPNLPPAFREQAVAISLQAIAEANKEMAALSTAPVGAAPVAIREDGTIPTMSIEIYKLEYEGARNPDFPYIYYRGDKPIASATVNGEVAEVVTSQAMDEGACVFVYEGANREKKCGGYMARIAAPEAPAHTVVLTATEDGGTAERTI